MPRLIYLFGIDGAGKTTHANLLARYLQKAGFMVWRTSVKQHHTLAYIFLKLFLKAGAIEHSNFYRGFRPSLQQKLRVPWKALELLSLILTVVYRVFIPLILGMIVVCDRYVIDSLVTLSYFLGDPALLEGRLARAVLMFIPSDTLLFHLDGDMDTLLERKRDEPLTFQIIQYYKEAYGKVSSHFPNVVRVNTTTLDIQQAHQYLRTLVDVRLGRA